MLSHWKYEGDPFTVELFNQQFSQLAGFVYLIVNKTNGKFYIGKKHFYSNRKKIATRKEIASGQAKWARTNPNGQKKILVRKISNWYCYCGSNEQLKADINLMGKEQFSFIILRLCEKEKQLTYFEESFLYFFKAIELDSSACYNDCIRKELTRNSIRGLSDAEKE
jgi:hypothetical protein